jgi:hypothetical protein
MYEGAETRTMKKNAAERTEVENGCGNRKNTKADKNRATRNDANAPESRRRAVGRLAAPHT